MDFLQLVPVILFSFIGFIWKNPIAFVVAGVTSLFTGFAYYDNYVSSHGLAVGLSFVIYWLVCWGFAFKYMFWKEAE